MARTRRSPFARSLGGRRRAGERWPSAPPTCCAGIRASATRRSRSASWIGPGSRSPASTRCAPRRRSTSSSASSSARSSGARRPSASIGLNALQLLAYDHPAADGDPAPVTGGGGVHRPRGVHPLHVPPRRRGRPPPPGRPPQGHRPDRAQPRAARSSSASATGSC